MASLTFRGCDAVKWYVLDPFKVIVQTPVVSYAARRKLAQGAEGRRSNLADMLLRTAAFLEGGSVGETDRLRHAIDRVVATNRSIVELQHAGVRRAAREVRDIIEQDAAQRLAATVSSLTSDVRGDVGEVRTVQQALQLKHAQQRAALQQANEQLDRDLSSMLSSRVDDFESDWTARESDVTPSQLYQRAMSDFNKEASELEEKSAEAKARLQRTLDARRLRQQQAKREKEMRARMGRMDELLRKHKAKIDAIVALDVAADGAFDSASGNKAAAAAGAWNDGNAEGSWSSKLKSSMKNLTRQRTVVQQLEAAQREPAAAPVVEDAATLELRAKLERLRPVALYKRAAKEGGDAATLEEAMGRDDAKARLIEILVELHLVRTGQRRVVAAPKAAPDAVEKQEPEELVVSDIVELDDVAHVEEEGVRGAEPPQRPV